jgi:hypothetical protein
MLKYLIFCSSVFLFSAYPQDEDIKYSKFRLLLNSGQRIETNNGYMTDTSLITIDDTGLKNEIPFSDIRAMDMSAGNHGLKGALIGGGIGAASFLLAVLEIETDPTRKLKENATEIILIGTAACTGVGYLIGLAYDDWEKVSLQVEQDAVSSNWGIQVSYKFKIY